MLPISAQYFIRTFCQFLVSAVKLYHGWLVIGALARTGSMYTSKKFLSQRFLLHNRPESEIHLRRLLKPCCFLPHLHLSSCSNQIQISGVECKRAISWIENGRNLSLAIRCKTLIYLGLSLSSNCKDFSKMIQLSLNELLTRLQR